VIVSVLSFITLPGIETMAVLVDRTASWEDIDYDALVLQRLPRESTFPASLLIRAG